jgi:high affinity Mn2+ porin
MAARWSALLFRSRPSVHPCVSPVCVRQLGLALMLIIVSTTIAGADEAAGTAAPAVAAVVRETWAIHGQFTYVEQNDSNFTAPYSGPNSLTPDRAKETTDATLSIGAALWPGAELWINEEIDQGFGLNNTLGVAGFPSGEAYKVGANQPYFRLPRLFVRDTLDGDGEREQVEATSLWLGGDRSMNRWVFTVGKFSVGDIFDSNQYAHDPRGDFLNWSAIDGGAFDYAADAWGFTVGAVAERYLGPWTFRAGVFDLSDVPNSPHLEPAFHEFQFDAEVEHRHEVAGHAGKLMLTAFDSRGRMAVLDQALQFAAANDVPIATALIDVRQYRSRLGGVFNLEQELTPGLGLFARYSKAAGNVEAYEFSDIDRSLEAGLSLKGAAWGRARDTVALALVDNGISAERERYLNAGGLGILVGDGRLPHPAPEEILETYYSVAVIAHAELSVDYQWIKNPAYNEDRGPVSVFAVRVHAQF